MLIIIKFSPDMLSWCSINTQSFAHDRSSSISQFLSGKSRNLWKLLRHLSAVLISAFKAGTGGCDGCSGPRGWDPSGFGAGCGCL